MQMKVVSGASIAAAAIALAVSGAAFTPQAQAKAGMVRCMGINSCKGQSDCKSATSPGKGLNSCKGHGFKLEKSSAACTKLGGKIG